MALRNQSSPKPALSSKVLIYGFSSIIAISAIILGVMGIEGIEEIENSQSFSNVAISGAGNAGTDIAISTNSDGGFAWGDINNDGCLDLVVNTNTKSPGTRILMSDCNATDPSFSDETTSICPGCESASRSDDVERSANLVDVNHDGYIDLIVNGNGLIEVYENSGAPNYEFGTAALSITSIPGGMNVEGVFIVDYDNDGWLDIILENHNFGIDVYQNPGDGSINFSYVDPESIGLPTTATDGDYGSALDFDDDGDVDIVARKKDQADFYINGGNGTFSTGVNVDDADNGNKGGVVFADFDNDGDYDLYWTDNGVNQIWRNDGGTLVATASTGEGEPWASAGITAPVSGIDGCAVGDVNNDGKVDLFLTNDTGAGYLFLNQTTNGGSLSFTQDNLNINVNGNGEGCSFGDYDNDGDLDLYVVTKNGNNQLWRNSLNDDNYLFVEPRLDLGDGLSRAALGANVIIKDCEGNIISGIREVATVSGHGTDAPDRVHFGLPSGPDELYNVVVKFLTIDGERVEVEKQINPSLVADRVLYIYDTDTNTVGRCRDFDSPSLPVEWSGFEGEWKGGMVSLNWRTAMESNSDFFSVERSQDGRVFEQIGSLDAIGNSTTETNYDFLDRNPGKPFGNQLFYRLRQVDINGTFDYSSTVVMSMEDAASAYLKVYPNPIADMATFEFTWEEAVDGEVIIYTMMGQEVFRQNVAYGTKEAQLNLSFLNSGNYVAVIIAGNQRVQQRIEKR